MLSRALSSLYDRLGARYPRAVLALIFPLDVAVVAASILLLTLYADVSSAQLLRILAVSELLVVLEVWLATRTAWRLVTPADAWLGGHRDGASASAAWRALAGLPVGLFAIGRGAPVVVNTLPIAAYITFELGGDVLSFLAIVAGAGVVVAYSVFLRFFAIEQSMRPVLAAISADLPDRADLGRATVSLRSKLLFGLPIINVVTGVVVVGLSIEQPSLRALGIGVLVAIGVAFTVSYELSALLASSLLEPLRALRRGTERVAAGDLAVRVPVLGNDETGRLAESFNEMVAGLQERERLREAFGAFVDPLLADRVLAEGTALVGEEVEVSVVFVDIRDFTAFAEHATAAQVVAELNGFYERVVPILMRHGGHANKFIGDGLLAVFGAPDRIDDHADHAVAAALELAAVVDRDYRGARRVGVGVNSGPVVAGTVGGGGRVEFTVIGDTVNTASRVEALTRETGDTVLITAATLALLRGRHGGFAPRGTVALRGRSGPVGVHAPLALRGGELGPTRADAPGAPVER